MYKVDSFKEKPCLEVAKQYLSDGGYLWNAGIFVWNVDTIMSSLREYVPGLASQMDEMAESFYTESETEVVGRIFLYARGFPSTMQSWRRLTAYIPSRLISDGAIWVPGDH